MNFGNVKNMIFSITDYSPEVDAYQEEVDRIANEVYHTFFSSRPWTFAQKEIDIYTQADITVDNGSITSTSPANRPSKFIQGVGAIAADLRNEGSIIQVLNATSDNDNGEYFLDSCDSTTDIWVSKKAQNDSQAWTISQFLSLELVCKQRYITLPPDCVEPLSITLRDPSVTSAPGPFGPVQELSRREDDGGSLWLDSTGTPTEWIPYDNLPGGELDVSDFPPLPGDLAVNAVACIAAAAWPSGTYNFYLAYRFRGRIGPIGKPVQIVITSSALAPTKPQFVTRDTTLSGLSGLKKHIFFNIEEFTASGYGDTLIRDMNDWSHDLAVPSGPGLGDIVGTKFYVPDDNIIIDVGDDWLDGVSFDPALAEYKLRSVPRAPDFSEGTYWRIRLSPRPNFYMPVRVRYIRKPNTLIADEDTPECPPDTHRYIVYRACEEIFTKHNALDQAELYRRKADNEEKAISQRWLTQRAANYIKKGFTSMSSRPFRRLVYVP